MHTVLGFASCPAFLTPLLRQLEGKASVRDVQVAHPMPDRHAAGAASASGGASAKPPRRAAAQSAAKAIVKDATASESSQQGSDEGDEPQ